MNTLQACTYQTLLAPVAAATTARTANLDCQGADFASIVIACGAELNTNSTNVLVNLRESDDTTATNFVTFNSTFAFTIDNTTAQEAVLHIDLNGRRRYLQVALTPDTTTNGPVITSAIGILRREIADSAHTNNADFVRVG